MRLRTNLATRPFYNVRAIRAIIGALVVLVLALTVFNAVQLLRLTGTQRTLGARAAQAEDRARQLRADASRIRGQINQKELEAVSSAAREANAIIDRRAFSWTELLTQLEATLPDDVRITTVQPRLDKEVFKVGLIAEARRAEDVEAFIEALEKTGAFGNVVPLQQQTTEGGLIEVAIEGTYKARVRNGGTGE
jgi:Tfp pilus assembly protein PilN